MTVTRAVFLDRDGTINSEVDNLSSLHQLRLLPKVGKAIKLLNQNNFLVIVITNQPVVARGWLTEENLATIHKELLHRLQKQNATVNAIYYCPHHPDANIKKYRIKCADRKPDIGLIRKAVSAFAISLQNSFFIGDSTTDIQTAKNAGIKSILVTTGYAGKDKKFNVEPEYKAKNLLAAVSYIISSSEK